MLNKAPTISTASRITDEPRPATPPAPPKPKPRLKRLRFLAILFSGLLLGLVSFVFGIFISVASDLPSLTKFALLKDAQSSVLLDDLGHPIGILSQQNRVIVTPPQIPQIVKEAVISIEDKRFESNSGIDIRGIARAFIQDTLHKGTVQGASTIEQQFIKNALQAQSHRTIFEKLREAALAYQLSHKWSKDKIITAYLNTIYFGNGAYGIESAARTYFGADVNHIGCGTPQHQLCVEQLKPWEAALLAGIIQSPTAYDPANHPVAAKQRRDLVLREMLNQGYLERPVYEESVNQVLPAAKDVQAPHEQHVEGVDVGYFTSWVRQQVIERYGAPRAFDGGLRITTTLDLELQRAAEQAVSSYLANPSGPTASLVAIENSTGEVRAMVGGRNYDESPFNLATQGERQPGSSFKAFDLAAALEDGISPESVWSSKIKTFYVPSARGTEKFVVHNDENAYAGSNTLTGATAYSDNSVYAEVGLKVGTARIAQLAQRMGINTPVSTNPAMTIGGLTVGVTPLDMAHAYETIAHGGRRVSGSLAESEAPVGIQEVDAGGSALPDGHHRDRNQVVTKPILPAAVASTETSMLETVLQYGTARAAALGQFAAGKTGTTTNFGDAWFIGWDSKYTVAVWVGYPNSLVPMTTEFNGKPVMGGTFPALIWHDFMTAALQVDRARAEHNAAAHAGNGQQGAAAGGGESAAPSTGTTGSTPSPSSAGKGATPSGGGKEAGAGAPAPSPEHAPATPTPPPASAPSPPSSAPPATPATPPTSSPPSSGGGSPTGGVSPSG
ncbi:MAG TPA: transglycosylase domain-containing protein [Solirubrobacteraceae bacterium]|jgi:penicillin-binding protein 1A|nr:transglycosylase domain-containing protein [Solirubrobacteraceae bacterium]